MYVKVIKNIFKKSIKVIFAPVVLSVISLSAFLITIAESADTEKPSTLPEIKLYSETSPFNTKIPSDAEIDPHSKRMIKKLVSAGKDGFVIGVKKWSVAVYFADENTPRQNVRFTAKWAPVKKMKNVPIPIYAKPDPSNDGSMAIIDLSSGCEYDFWQARKKKGKWKASWGNAVKTDDIGIFPKGLSARGSGFALLAGLIWPHELKNGAIGHALLFIYGFTKAGGPVSPATESDGWSKNRKAMPEGARIQLDPELDIDSLGLNEYEKTVAKAMQEYGMFLGDDGGGVEIEAINPISVNGNPYADILPDKTYVDLSKIPLNRFRVLKLPAQTKHPDIEIVPTDCTE